MPRIAEIVRLPDGRMAAVFEVLANEGAISLWTHEESERAIASAVAIEREECAKIAEQEAESALFADHEPLHCRQAAERIRARSST